ncbi:unnamed protein product [Lathyrus sativus]|nr:unnamed protein product [Lathyrus sativus]
MALSERTHNYQMKVAENNGRCLLPDHSKDHYSVSCIWLFKCVLLWSSALGKSVGVALAAKGHISYSEWITFPSFK